MERLTELARRLLRKGRPHHPRHHRTAGGGQVDDRRSHRGRCRRRCPTGRHGWLPSGSCRAHPARPRRPEGRTGYLRRARVHSIASRLRDDTEAVVYAPRSERAIEDPIAGAVAIERHVPLVVTEGNYLLVDDGARAEVRHLLDTCWYVDLPATIRQHRLTARHEGYGRSAGEALGRTLGSDQVNAEMVEATRHRADRHHLGLDQLETKEAVHGCRGHVLRSTFPMCSPAPTMRCASATADIGRIRSTTGRISPDSRRGQTCSRTAATIVAFSSAGRGGEASSRSAPRASPSMPRGPAPPRVRPAGRSRRDVR